MKQVTVIETAEELVQLLRPTKPIPEGSPPPQRLPKGLVVDVNVAEDRVEFKADGFDVIGVSAEDFVQALWEATVDPAKYTLDFYRGRVF